MSAAAPDFMDSLARDSEDDGSWLKRSLATVASSVVCVFARVARRLGYPALATVPVSAAMLTRLETVSIEQPLEDVAQTLVAGRHLQLPVVADGTPVGVVTRQDIALGVEQAGPHAPLAAAPRHDALVVGASDSLVDVFARLRAMPDAVAVVIDHGEPVGLLTLDSVAAYLEAQKAA
jgi:predicted transcriptional regulator